MKILSRIAVVAVTAAVTFVSTVSCSLLSDGGSQTEEPRKSETEAGKNDGSFYDKDVDGINVSINVMPEDNATTSLVEMLDRTRPAVVEVYAALPGGTSAGSGVIVDIKDTDGNGSDDTAVIVTCHHVIEGAVNTMVKSIYGEEYTASLIGSDPVSDIGVISIKADTDENLDELTFASWYSDSDNLKVGMEVVAIGNPLGYLGGTVTQGIVSAINRDVKVEDRMMTLIQTNAAINGGNSGGGLFDVNTGALVGIVNAGYASYAAQGLNFAIPSNVAMNIERQLLETYNDEKYRSFGYIDGNYSFGAEFSLAYQSSFTSRNYYVTVSSLDDYGTFAQGGIKVNDLIYSVRIADKEMNLNSITSGTISELTKFLNQNYSIGDEVVVSYGRYENRSYVTHTAEFEISQYIYGRL